MRLLTGTSGFSYRAWKGSFYPRDLRAADMLAFYASRLRTVEINSTFYRTPDPGVVARWAEAVPDTFVFAVKASRWITHRSRLSRTPAEVESLWRTLAPLGARLGPVLFQLPPNFRKDVPLLAAFLAELPRGCRAAFEFRHASWADGEVHEALRRAGAALCSADVDDLPEPGLVATADWGYLRLRRARYPRRRLASWAERVARTGWREAFVFFKHEEGDPGIGPKLAQQIAQQFAKLAPQSANLAPGSGGAPVRGRAPRAAPAPSRRALASRAEGTRPRTRRKGSPPEQQSRSGRGRA